ncbi:hypothetical protein DFJ58DRAFT_265794 [Suillus subalutaceus]|uniref:uncharacterized protein n=1 Tax=Suillus subalutaceus TaxID=48586 RepID=UPI001B866EA7|nr:uncharacterized protein DFJ58DRAFT_265794 [Suillus subalutaceus]KAG1861192.1 hypothetical protein DFJ58DRAFT_265794 [Suillus subalutaceus]
MSSETGCSGVPYLFSLELLVSLGTLFFSLEFSCLFSLELLVSLAIFCAPTHFSTLPLYIRYGLEFAVVCDRIHWGPRFAG